MKYMSIAKILIEINSIILLFDSLEALLQIIQLQLEPVRKILNFLGFFSDESGQLVE